MVPASTRFKFKKYQQFTLDQDKNWNKSKLTNLSRLNLEYKQRLNVKLLGTLDHKTKKGSDLLRSLTKNQTKTIGLSNSNSVHCTNVHKG